MSAPRLGPIPRAAAIAAGAALIGVIIGFVLGAREASAAAAAHVVERGFRFGAVVGVILAAIDFRRTSRTQ